MATDTSIPSATLAHGDSQADSFFSADQQDSVFIQVAQADGAPQSPPAAPGAVRQVAVPAGTNVVRVAVQPGEVLELSAPFTGGAELIGRIGDGNLAIKVGDVTIILQGYVDANQQAPITVETSDGQSIDVATMLASTDPTIDIQTAAGPGDTAAGPQGADNNGALFSQFGPGGGLAGFTGVGAQDQTQLSYGLIDNSINREFATTLAALNGGTFGIVVGSLANGHSERFFRDPAQTEPFSNASGTFFDNFMDEYKDAVENPSNPLFPGWADFQGTGATNGDFQEYLDQTLRTVDVDVTFTGATGDLVLDGLEGGITSNGSPLTTEVVDDGHTMFVRRETDNALVAVVHVVATDTGFTIETVMVNRLDHPGAANGEAGRDDMVIGVNFTVYDGLAPSAEQPEGTPQSQSLPGTASFSFQDDIPLFDNVTYHNIDGDPIGDGMVTKDSTAAGLVDEDWLLQTGARDNGADGASNAGDNGDTKGSYYVTGQVNIDFGADGPSQSDNPGYEGKGKHAFALDIGSYVQDADFPYGDGGTLSSGGRTLVVLEVSENHLVVGIPAPESEGDAIEIDLATPIFSLTLDQDTGAFTFTLYGPLDHFSDLFPGLAENTIPLGFNVIATDDDGDTVTAPINIDVNDDIPMARDDSDNVAAGSYDPQGGNVISGLGTESPIAGADTMGADGAKVTGVAAGNLGADQDGHVGTEVQGTYGKLTLFANGDYTYVRDPNTGGGDKDIFTYTLTDADGDTSTAHLTIKIGDTPPTITDITPEIRGGDVTVDEDDLSAARNVGEGDGSDQSDSTTQEGDFTISAPDGVKDLNIGGNAIITDGVFTATSFTTPFGNTLSVTAYDPATGKVTYSYTLNDNYLHPTGNGENDVFEQFQVQLTDKDGDGFDTTLSARIVDDVPSDYQPQDQSLLNAPGGVITGALDAASHTGADGMETIVFTGGKDGDQATLADGTTPITSGGKDIVLSGFGTDMLTGYVDANKNEQVDSGEEVFTVKLDGAGDQYAFTLIKAIDDGSHLGVAYDFSSIHAGKQDWYGLGANAGGSGSVDLLYTPLVPSTQDVNTSSKDLGSNDQWLDAGEGIRIDFVKGLTGDFDTKNDFDFAHHYQVTDFEFTVVQVGGKDTTSMRLTAANATKDANDGTTSEADFLAQTLVAITAGELMVLRGGIDITDTLTIDYTDGGKNDGGVIIQGLEQGDVVQVHDADGFDRLSIDSTGDKQFSIGESKVLETTGGTDLDVKFETTMTDKDGDTSSGQFNINLQTDDGTGHTFTCGPGDDTIQGGKGSDLIFGNEGNDTMLYDAKDTFNGGDGFDRVLVGSGGHAITFDSAKFIGIEMIDLGAGDDRSGAANHNALALSAGDVVAANGSNATAAMGHQINFFVIGDTSGPSAGDKDSVHLTDFNKIDSGSFADPVTGVSHDYDIYQSSTGPVVKVAIEQGLDVT